MTTPTAAIVVVAAVITRGDRILACRRNADREEGGLWEFPGGKVESGEAPTDALVREIREELGVGIRVGPLLHRGVTVVGPKSVDLRCYAATLVDASPVSSTDHDRIGWFRPSELDALEWPAPDRPVVALLVGRAR